jgi:hypothetical protein
VRVIRLEAIISEKLSGTIRLGTRMFNNYNNL